MKVAASCYIRVLMLPFSVFTLSDFVIRVNEHAAFLLKEVSWTRTWRQSSLKEFFTRMHVHEASSVEVAAGHEVERKDHYS